MIDSHQLAMLIHQVRTTTSPLARIKAVALAWRTLRGLDAHERMQLARELGAEGAERLIEGLASQDGLRPAALLTAIHKAETSGTESIREALGELLFPEDAAQGHDQPSQPAQSPALPPPPPTASVAEPSAAQGEHQDGQSTAETPTHAVQKAAATPTRRAPARSTPRRREPPQRPAESQSEHPRVHSREPDPTAQPAGKITGQPAGDTAGDTARSSAPGRGGTEPRLYSRIAAEGRPLARLLLLTQHGAEARGLDVQQLRELASLFPDGWMRRRAVEALLRCLATGQAAAAIDVVHVLGRPADQLWALAGIAARPDLKEPDRHHLLQAAESPQARRRLELRLERARDSS